MNRPLLGLDAKGRTKALAVDDRGRLRVVVEKQPDQPPLAPIIVERAALIPAQAESVASQSLETRDWWKDPRLSLVINAAPSVLLVIMIIVLLMR